MMVRDVAPASAGDFSHARHDVITPYGVKSAGLHCIVSVAAPLSEKSHCIDSMKQSSCMGAA